MTWTTFRAAPRPARSSSPACRWAMPAAPRSGLGRRLGGRPAELVAAEVQARTAEQLFQVLGELKGGAMKFGQAMSVFEAALPENLAGPYRETLTRLQEAAPPLPARTVHRVLARELGADWRDRFRGLRRRAGRRGLDRPGAPRDVGRRSRGRRQGAVPRCRRRRCSPTSTRSAGWAGWSACWFPASRSSRWSRSSRHGSPRSSTTSSRRRARPAFATAYDGDPDVLVPHVVHGTEQVLVSEWVDGHAAVARHRRRQPGAARPGRPAARPVPVLRPGARRPAARRPAPRATSGCSTTAGSSCSTSAPSTGCPTGCPRRSGRCSGSPSRATRRECSTGCASRGLRATGESTWTRDGCSTTWRRSSTRPAPRRSASAGPGCAVRRSGSATRAHRRTAPVCGSTCRRSTCSSTGSPPARSGCCASSGPRLRGGPSSSTWLPGFAPPEPRKRTTRKPAPRKPA